MLVLSRKQHEAVHVGSNITITVLGIRGGTVKLGIEAPNKVRILRGELPTWDEVPASENAQPSVAGATLEVAFGQSHAIV